MTDAFEKGLIPQRVPVEFADFWALAGRLEHADLKASVQG